MTTPFMQSDFIRACQATLDADEGLSRAAELWNDAGVSFNDWPNELRQWLTAQMAADHDDEVSNT